MYTLLDKRSVKVCRRKNGTGPGSAGMNPHRPGAGWCGGRMSWSVGDAEPAAVDLVAADDVEAQRGEGVAVVAVEDVQDVLVIEHLPLVQPDQHVAALQPGLGGGALRAD